MKIILNQNRNITILSSFQCISSIGTTGRIHSQLSGGTVMQFYTPLECLPYK